MTDVLVLVAHPQLEHSRTHRTLLQAVRRLPAERVLVRDLYALYPDYIIDVEAEQALLGKEIALQVQRLGDMLGPFAQALDKRLQPGTAERMTELLAANLRRYPKFNQHFVITSVGTRQYLDRALEWSGLRRSDEIAT